MRSPAWADGACVAAGGLLFLAFSPWNFAPVAVAALAVLFRSVLRASPRRAFCRGLLFGLAGFGVGLWWIAESFQYRDLGIASAVGMTGMLVFVLALFTAVFGWASARFLGAEGPLPEARARAAAALWWFPAAWTLFEWLRGALFSGFTWLQVGYAGLESPLASYAPLGGSYAVGLAISVTAASFALAGAARHRAVAGALVVSTVLWAGGAVLTALDAQSKWTRPAGEPLRVLIVQGNVAQGEKWSEQGRSGSLDRYSRLTAGHPGVELVVWPETAIPYFAARVRPFLRAAGEAAEKEGYVLLAGLLSFDPASGGVYNSVVRISSPRSVDAPVYYHKRHLVPFSERLPLAAVLAPVARWLRYPTDGFIPGAERQVPIEVGEHQITVSICYEVTFGAATARVLGDGALLVNVSNDAWFGRTVGPHQHFQMARMRALELGRWLVRSTNTGISALVSPKGRVTASLPAFETDVLKVDVPPLEGRTPYARWRDVPLLVLVALMMVIARWVRRATPGGRVLVRS